MKASELIKALQEEITKVGDLKVKSFDYGIEGFDISVNSVKLGYDFL